jgi:DNA repair protein RecO (recombination protein O)
LRLFTDEAFILEVGDLSDSDRLVVFYTRLHGQKRGAARNARRRYSRFAGHLQPLARVHVGWAEKEGRELVRVHDVELVQSNRKVQEDLEGILVGSYLAEHLKVFAPVDETDEVLFRLFASALEALEHGVDRDLVARYFEAWILRRSGVFPLPTECPGCGRLLYEVGGLLPAVGESVVCRDCATTSRGLEVTAEEVLFYLESTRRNLREMVGLATRPEVLRQLERLHREVRRRFLQGELKSYGVMRRILGEEGV